MTGHRRDSIGLRVVFRRREDFGRRQRGGVYYARADFRHAQLGMGFGRTAAYFSGCGLRGGGRRHDADAVRAEGRLKRCFECFYFIGIEFPLSGRFPTPPAEPIPTVPPPPPTFHGFPPKTRRPVLH